MKLDKPDPSVRVSVGYAAVPAKGREGYETEFNLLVYDNENGMLLETIVNRAFDCWRELYAEAGYIEGRYIDGEAGS